MCGGGNKSSGPSAAEVAAREQAAATAARQQVLAEQAALAKKANEEMIAGKAAAANAESEAAAKQLSVLGSINKDEKDRAGNLLATEDKTAPNSYAGQESAVGVLSDEQKQQQARLKAQAAKTTLLGG